MDRLKRDLATYYGYNDYFLDLVLNMFSAAEAVELFEANEQTRPMVREPRLLDAATRVVKG